MTTLDNKPRMFYFINLKLSVANWSSGIENPQDHRQPVSIRQRLFIDIRRLAGGDHGRCSRDDLGPVSHKQNCVD